MSEKITVLGGGAWGTALAATALRAGNRVALWARDATTVKALNETHENPRYLRGIVLPEGIEATVSEADALRDSACVLAVTPAQSMHEILPGLAGVIAPGIPIVLCAKGIDRQTGRLMSQIASEALPANPVAALSGPSFATDVARGLPTAVTIAANEEDLAADIARMLSSSSFRCYSTDDLTGVEIGGALKNVLAIAAGAVSGAGLGASAQAAVITRGFVELRRIGAAFGARPETLMGLSGLGDLILSCGSAQSRNFAYGMALGRGEPVEGRPLAEGVATAGIAERIAAERELEAPIITATAALLRNDITLDEAISGLLARPLKSETE